MQVEGLTYFEKAVERIKEISEKVFQHPEARVILFGSRANGSFRRVSDIDIALQNVSRMEKSVFEEMVENSDIIYSVDITLWEDLPESFREKILKEGKVIWSRSSKDHNMEKSCMR